VAVGYVSADSNEEEEEKEEESRGLQIQ